MSEGWKNGKWERFKCPLCASTSYVEVRVQRPATGNWYVTPFYQCFHCTVMFTDPVLFTRCSSKRQPGVPRVEGMTSWAPDSNDADTPHAETPRRKSPPTNE